jgi:galactose mutarotase-like enzyme
MTIKLRNQNLAVTLEPELGARISSLKFLDVEMLLQAEPSAMYDPIFGGSYAMVPFAGRIRDGKFQFKESAYQIDLCPGHPHAMHGYALDQSWTVTESTESIAVMNTALDTRWPFGGFVEQQFELTDDSLKLTISFRANKATPVWVGWHPWWKRTLENSSDANLEFSAQNMLEREAALPTGKLTVPKSQPWDDAFCGLTENPRITWSNFAQLEMTSSHEWWVVYDERSDAICVEPQSGPPNAIELGLATQLETNQTHSMSTEWIFRSI